MEADSIVTAKKFVQGITEVFSDLKDPRGVQHDRQDRGRAVSALEWASDRRTSDRRAAPIGWVVGGTNRVGAFFG